MQTPLRACSALLLALLVSPAIRAEAILDRLPANTIAFARIKNLAATSEKVERVARIFQEVSPMPIPPPLDMIKAATGLGGGVNEQGDAVLALLPGEQGVANVRPLLLVAVTDYAAFAQSINGDATGEISRVIVAGEEVLAAKVGEFAALMNVEHRDSLESLVASEPSNDAIAMKPFAEWLATTDVAVALTPAGHRALTEFSQAAAADQQFAAQTPPGLRSLLEMIVAYQQMLRFLDAEVSAVAAGLSIDDDANVKFTANAILSKQGMLAPFSSQPAAEVHQLAGFADDPFVVAGGLPIPPEFAEECPALIREVIQVWPELYSFDGFAEEDWAEVEHSWRQTLKGVTRVGSVLYVGGKDDPLLDNFYSLAEVDDPDRYVESYAAAERTWNELVARSKSDIKLQSEIAQTEVAGQKGIVITADLLKAGEDPNVPGSRILMKALAGEDGKSELFVVPASDTQVVLGWADAPDVAKAIQAVEKGGLHKSSTVEATTKLLNEDAAATAFISPQGVVAYANRWFNSFIAPLGNGTMEFPEFKDSPPIGLSLAVRDGRKVSGEIIWPAETLTALAAHIKKWEEQFRQ